MLVENTFTCTCTHAYAHVHTLYTRTDCMSVVPPVHKYSIFLITQITALFSCVYTLDTTARYDHLLNTYTSTYTCMYTLVITSCTLRSPAYWSRPQISWTHSSSMLATAAA